MLLEIIIVSFNTEELLKNCLKSLTNCLIKEKLEEKTQITVVDNNSQDNSIKMVRTLFPEVKIIANRNNTGFAKANNQAIRESKAEFIFLLNSDTVVHNNAVSELLKSLREGKSAMAAGPKLINPDGSLQQSFGFAPDFFKVLFWMFFLDDIPFLTKIIKPYHASRKEWYASSHKVDWVTGAALIFKKDVVTKVGLLDENIFMYGEEVEWCYRIRKTGGEIIFNPDATIMHLGGGSQKDKGNSIIREFASIVYFYEKHRKTLLFPIRLVLKIGALLRLILFGIIGGKSSKISLYAKAFKMA